MTKSLFDIALKLQMLFLLLLLSCGKENEEVFNGIFSKKGSLATILTTPATSVTDTSAEAGGNLTDNGSTYIIARGICWGTDQNPDTSDFKIETGKEPGEFACNITGLSKGTLYYMRAYVSNTIGTAYGNQETFTTLNIPTIITVSISDITDTTAVSGGNITSDGGVNITARGVCWSKKQNPAIADTISKDGSGKGIFTSSLKRLVPNTTYYIKAWATNSVGTAYGNELAFTTTSPAPLLPSITTSAITTITQTTAVSGGVITSDGGAPVTSRGVCWGTSASPTISNSKTTDGTGTEAFSSSVTGLSPGTIYYLRAYATNSVGSAYGNELTFTTPVATTEVPSITTTAISSITQTTANTGGNVSSDGGATVTARGVCWGTSTSPTIANSKTADGTGTGTFSSSITGLTPGTLYYIRAYATNSIGTVYGNEISFTTLSQGSGTVTDVDGNIYNTVVIGTQTWLKENLRTTRYRDGTTIPNITLNSVWSASTSGAYCWYNNNQATYKETYGALYNYYATVDNRNLCPIGWHVPTDNEWTTLTTFLGGESVAGGKLKELGITHWVDVNFGATNESGFTSIPGGYRGYNTMQEDGTFNDIGTNGYWWSITEDITTYIWVRVMHAAISSVSNSNHRKQSGFSVRCLQGEGNFLPDVKTNSISAITQNTATCSGQITSNGGPAITNRGVCWSTSSNPMVTLTTKTSEGTGYGSFISQITGLIPGTKYYVRAYSTYSYGTAYGNEISFTTLPSGSATVTDIDGNIYNTVTIGTQTWMKENLKTTRYRDGTTIPNVTDNSAWSLLTSGAYCWWVNDQATNKATYGALYNYYAIDTRNLCPTGWHVPTNSEWTTLTTYLGGESIAGSKLKETGNTHWMSYNTDATNESGFTAIPGGYRVTDGSFMNLGAIGYWWSSTDFSGSSSWGRIILHNNTMVSNSYFNKVSGFSVRCLQGETVVLPGIMTTTPTVYNTSVSTGGNLLTTGGGTITDMGVCWSTSPNVTISSGSKSSAGTTALGVYTIPIPSLTPLTTYYIKAYATNSAGTGYGVEFSFTTGDGLPSVSTTSISGISNTSASSGGTITTLGNVSANTRGVCWSTTTNPTIADSKTADGSGAGIFTSSITGLSANTTYYVRAYATNSVGTVYGNEISFTTLSQSSGTVTDIDGNVYNTIVIGSQTWMKENLKTTKYRDGSSIPNATDNTAWILLTSGAYCWFLNDQTTYKATYGAIYNYYVVESRNLCPTGWHVPTESEWTTLTSYLGGESIAGGKLKEAGTDHWQTPNTGANNETAFTALPGGYRAYDNGLYYSLGSYGYWSSSTEKSPSLMWGYYLNYNNSFLFSLNLDKRGGYSVRCLLGESAPFAVGDSYQGGKIAYIFQPGDNGYVAGQVHGLIAAPSDQSTGAEWGCNGINISGADSTGLGRGIQNTIDIVTGCATAGTAAKICSDLVLSGYSDWYLPSRDELNKLYLNQTAIGGFSTSVYWSSSEYNEFAASIVAFGPGGISNVFKYETHYVRAVRSF